MRMPSFLRLCLLAYAMAPGLLHAADWKPVDPAELALKAPKVQPQADAEAIFWEIRVADQLNMNAEPTTVFEHYIRIKIFTDRGREDHATVDLPYYTGLEVSNVGARTIRPNGSIVELQKSDTYQRVIVKAEGFKIKVVSFAVPAIEPGAIIEYRWRETYRYSLANNLRLPFSRDVPVQIVRYYIRPLSIGGLDWSMQAIPFNATMTPPERQKDGSSMISLANVPSQADEPYATPPYERRPWLFIYYGLRNDALAPDFWLSLSREIHEDYRDHGADHRERR